MNEMVDLAARAIAENAGDHTAVVGSKVRRQARAVIVALLQPSEGMTRAGHLAWDHPTVLAPGPFTIEKIYRAMMKEALEEQE